VLRCGEVYLHRLADTCRSPRPFIIVLHEVMIATLPRVINLPPRPIEADPDRRS
jgi:hypothetical protein